MLAVHVSLKELGSFQTDRTIQWVQLARANLSRQENCSRERVIHIEPAVQEIGVLLSLKSVSLSIGGSEVLRTIW